MYKLIFHKQALKDLETISKKEIIKIKEKIWQLKETPRPPGCKKLKGLQGLYRIRIGQYRAVYAIQDKVLIIVIFNIRHRSNIYRDY